MIKPVATVRVKPKLPKPLFKLEALANNLYWSWEKDAVRLFRRMDPEIWEATGHNPIKLLGDISQDRLQKLANDSSFIAYLDEVNAGFEAYMKDTNTWYKKNYKQFKQHPIIAYFSMEFGITECIMNYSGGLGILSGDHMKSASDLDLPLVGVGLLYQEGYFQQYLNSDGWQQERYPINDFPNLPMSLETDKDGNVIKISVPLPGRSLYAQIWKVQVGRVALYLLDSNVPENALAEDRNLTDRLYGGDRRTRIRQEILMGIGGIRALEVLGLRPDICHMNEGHSAFLLLERIRQLMNERNLSFHQARQIAASALVFTIHTPVPAGLERFGFDLIDEHFSDYIKEVGITRDEFIDLARESMGDNELFSMSVMALKNSFGANGVAQLHGVVSRDMWQWVYPDLDTHEIPIDAITNGVHAKTWTAYEMGMVFDRYLGPEWREDASNPKVWEKVENIPDSELWKTHSRRRERLVGFARRRLRHQLENQGVSQTEVEEATEVLNPDILTIGFARRFATYKRATLIFSDLERLNKLLNDPDRPVQFLFAGKAHPHDNEGKKLIQKIYNISRMPEFRHRLVFLENYDMEVGRYLVQGVDVWLNNPRRPKEASGTSGMKVIYNGGLNCSILDGWWDEAYSTDTGWAIGNGELYSEDLLEFQDQIESQALYNVLEKDIIPLFYRRGRDGVPRQWITKVKSSMRILAPFFTTRRMVKEYAEHFYMPNYQRLLEFNKNPDAMLSYANWRNDIEHMWQQVKIEEVKTDLAEVAVGSKAEIETIVQLGSLKPKDVCVQLYFGNLDSKGNIVDGKSTNMELAEELGNGSYRYKTQHIYNRSGEEGLSVRVLPHHEFLYTNFLPHMVTWA